MQADELVYTIEHLQGAIEDLTIRGIRSAGPEQINKLASVKDEFDRIGAAHLSSRISAVIDGIKSGDRKTAAALMRAQASLRLFERVLTLEMVEQRIGCLVALEGATIFSLDPADEDEYEDGENAELDVDDEA